MITTKTRRNDATMTRSRLQHEFQAVRQQFFPRWDRTSRWRIRQVSDLNGAYGRAYPETRTIRISHLLDGDKGTALLIHEIAHAASNCGHGKKWQERMERAALAADAMNRPELARMLRDDVAGYRDPLASVTARLVYQEISDAVVQARNLTFLQVVDSLRRNYGLSRKEFLDRFRRARNVFEREKRFKTEMAKVKAKLMATPSPTTSSTTLVWHSGPEVTKRYIDPTKLPGNDATELLPMLGMADNRPKSSSCDSPSDSQRKEHG